MWQPLLIITPSPSGILVQQTIDGLRSDCGAGVGWPRDQVFKNGLTCSGLPTV